MNINPYWRLMRLDKPIGTLLLLWPTLTALFIAADGMPSFHLFFIFTLGTLLMRSAGCVINDYADRDFDGYVKRTKSRPIPAGEISAEHALTLFFILSFCAFLLVITLNLESILLSVLALVLATLYPFMKRFIAIPQLFLGIAYSWSILMTFVAQRGHIPMIGYQLFFGNIFWVIAYDTMYAMVDRDDDRLIGIQSSALLFGCWDKVCIGLLQIMAFCLWFFIGYQVGLSFFYYMMLALIACLFLWQQYLIKDRIRQACFQAFLNNNYVGLALFLGTIIDLALR